MNAVFAGDKPAHKVGGMIQATAIQSENNKAIAFGFDRVRMVAKGVLNERTSYKLQVDFVKASTSVDKDGDTQGIIKDAEITYNVVPHVKVKVGKTKTPIGLEFNTSGTALDFVKRNLGQKLVFERNAGIMVMGDKFTPAALGFRLGVFNHGPSGANAVGDIAAGADYTLVGRVTAKPIKPLYLEASFGSALSSIDSVKSVSIFGGGAQFKVGKALKIKGEYMSRSDASNTSADGTFMAVWAGYEVLPYLEPVVKYETLDVTNDSKDQNNIVFGVNYFLNPESHNQSKIMFNYFNSDKDGASAVQFMFQVAF